MSFYFISILLVVVLVLILGIKEPIYARAAATGESR